LKSRTAGFDLIRITAAFVVFLGHLGGQGGVDLVPVSSHAGLAVMAFFALSGYLIYKPFLNHKVRVSEHYANRLLRIVPAWAIATVGIGTVMPTALSWLVMVTWSLLVELAFYATLPLLARLAAGRELATLGGLGVASLAAFWFMPPIAVPVLAMPLTLPIYFWAFAPGMCLAVIQRDRPDLIRPRPLFIAGVTLLVGGLAWASLGDATGTYSAAAGALVAAGTAATMASSLGWNCRRGTALIALAADASYPFYLWHASILATLSPLFRGLALGVIGFAVAATVSVASVVVVERPLRRAWVWVKKPRNAQVGLPVSVRAGKTPAAGD
jgi:peptidoglycan/LPS O-acetylase OafA/YrhL